MLKGLGAQPCLQLPVLLQVGGGRGARGLGHRVWEAEGREREVLGEGEGGTHVFKYGVVLA